MSNMLAQGREALQRIVGRARQIGVEVRPIGLGQSSYTWVLC
jgi:hypothetical protein